MNKNFTVSIPDELYSSENTLNKTLTLEYVGPETLNILVSPSGNADIKVDMPRQGSVVLDASEDTAAAYLLNTPPVTTNYVLEDEVLDDGTIYKNISNPNLHDYYTVKYSEADGWELVPIIRQAKTPGLIKAEYFISKISNLIARTQLEDNPLVLAPEILTALEEYSEVLAEYSLSEQPKKSWKYETYSDIPVVPELLQQLLGE
jgi:hypothetical protein